MPAKPKIAVKRIRDLGPQLTENRRRMMGQDGAYSIPLNGETLWFFGDTLFGERVPGESLWYPGGEQIGPEDMSGHGKVERMINNCGLLLDNHDARDGLQDFRYILDPSGEIKTLIPLEADEDPDEIRVWCMHGITVGKQIYLFFIKVRMLAEGPLPVNFEILGSGMAAAKVGEWNFRRVLNQNSDLFWHADDPQFGSAAILDKDREWLYLFGVKKDAQFTQQSCVARVRPREIEHREKYEFLVAPDPRWSKDVNLALPLFDGPPNEQSISWNDYLDCYLAVHSMDITGKIVARTAPTIAGPWSEPAELTRIIPDRPKPLPYPPLVYAGKEHPELSRENGRIIYVTYIEFEEYFPHLLEIELA